MRRLPAWSEFSNTGGISITASRLFKIVCPHDYSRKRFGLFPDGCPNLLWELMRTRRERLSASQLMRKNPIEAIVDKDNHLRDALKYILLSLPSPSERPKEMKRDELIREAFATGTYATLEIQMAHLDADESRQSSRFRVARVCPAGVSALMMSAMA